MRSSTSKFAFVENPKGRTELGSQAHFDFFSSVIRRHGFETEFRSRLDLIDPSYKLVLIDTLSAKLFENGLDVDLDHYLLNGTIATIDTAVPKKKNYTNKDYRTARMHIRFEDGEWLIQKIEIRHAFDECDEAVKIYLNRHALAKVLNRHMSKVSFGHLECGQIVEDDDEIEIRHACDECDEAVKIYLNRHALAKVLNRHMSKVSFGHLECGQIVEDDDEIDSDFVAAGFPLEADKDVAILI